MKKTAFGFLFARRFPKLVFCSLAIGLPFFISACCSGKQYCLGFDDINEIQLLNFDSTDVDSLAFEIYKGNTDFSSRIDSSFTRPHRRLTSNSSLVLLMTEYANLDHDYKITLLSTGQVFKLTRLKTTSQDCNCPSDQISMLKSYELNGQEKSSSVLAISQ